MSLSDAPRRLVARLCRALLLFHKGFPPGHFYSPIPSISSVFRREARIFHMPPEIPGVDLNVDNQLEILVTSAQISHS